MWVMKHPKALAQLDVALNERFPRTSVHAAMAQIAEQGDASSAVKHARLASENDPLMVGIRGWGYASWGMWQMVLYFDAVVSA